MTDINAVPELSTPRVGPHGDFCQAMFADAVREHRAGNLNRAAELYARVLQVEPLHVAALSNNGVVLAALGRQEGALDSYRRARNLSPRDPEILTNLGNLLLQRGESERAGVCYRQALESGPGYVPATSGLMEVFSRDDDNAGAIAIGLAAYARDPSSVALAIRVSALHLSEGEADAAELLLEQALSQEPNNAQLLGLMGDVWCERKDRRAEEFYRRAAAEDSAWYWPWYRLATLANESGRVEESFDLFEKAERCDPNPPVLRDYGEALHKSGRSAEGLEKLADAFEQDNSDFRTALTLGNVLSSVNHNQLALDAFKAAHQLRKDEFEPQVNIGIVLQRLGRYEEAMDALTGVHEAFPTRVEAHLAIGHALYVRDVRDEAEQWYSRGLQLEPHNVELKVHLAQARMENAAPEEGLSLAEDVLAEAPGHLFAHKVKAQALSYLNRHEEAIHAAGRAMHNTTAEDVGTLLTLAGILERGSHRTEALQAYQVALSSMRDGEYIDITRQRVLDLQLALCDWREYDTWITGVINGVRKAVDTESPLHVCIQDLQNVPISWELLAGAAKRRAAMIEEETAESRKKMPMVYGGRTDKWRAGQRDKIRIGWALPYTFLHSFPLLLKAVTERIDRNRFDVYGYSIRPGDGAFDREYRKTFDVFRDVPAGTPDVAARIINQDKIDVLIDVTGHTSINCQPLMSFRPAPVQAHMLGYGITTGANYIDYLVTDGTWLKPEFRPHCTEKIVYLPDNWLVGPRNSISDKKFTRTEFGLPEDGFVFCNFNQTFKMEPTIFDVWMQILKRVPGSVLWLGAWDKAVRDNLGREAQDRGVDATRLVFSEIIGVSDHLARLQLADLAFDNRWHGGGATTLDALWAGVPVITLPGSLPTSCNGLSLATALGVPEMAVGTLKEYEELATGLATDPERYRVLRQKVWDHRETYPLFDCDRYVRHFERAVEMMWEASIAGDDRDLTVAPITAVPAS